MRLSNVHERRPQSGGLSSADKGEWVFFRCRRPHFSVQKLRNLLCPHEQWGKRVRSVRTRGQLFLRFCADVFYVQCQRLAGLEYWVLLCFNLTLKKVRQQAGLVCFYSTIVYHSIAFLLLLLELCSTLIPNQCPSCKTAEFRWESNPGVKSRTTTLRRLLTCRSVDKVAWPK